MLLPLLTIVTRCYAIFSVLAKRLAGKSVSEINYFVSSSGTLNHNSINYVISASHRHFCLLRPSLECAVTAREVQGRRQQLSYRRLT